MKNISLYIIALAGFSLVACNKRLDINPTAEFEDAYFQDEDHLQR